jgi:hypothetical protein
MLTTPDKLRHTAPGRPFETTDQAWFWTIAALQARAAGTGGTARSGTERPCDPDDVIRALDQLYRARRIDLLHARILRIWGERGTSPSPLHPREAQDAAIWQEAMARLGARLCARGIVMAGSAV